MDSKVTNCSFHHGLGWGISVRSSSNIHFEQNVVYGFRPVGVSFASANNITFNNNIVGHIWERILETFKFIDKRGAVIVCSYFNEKDNCKDIFVNDNLVAGAQYAGFIAPGHTCGDTTSKIFRNNTARSMHGSIGGGMGAVVYPDPSTA